MLVCQDLWLLSKKSSMSLILIILMRPLPLKKLGLSLDSMDWGKKTLPFLVPSPISFIVFSLTSRSAVKSFGIERFKQNCTKATEGFNHVLYHLYYMKQVREKKWTEMKELKQKGVEAIRDKMSVKTLANTEESWKLKSSYTEYTSSFFSAKFQVWINFFWWNNKLN